jgi:hypothetical protein
MLHNSACVTLHHSTFLVYLLDRTLGMGKNLLQFLGRGRHLLLVQELLSQGNHRRDRG